MLQQHYCPAWITLGENGERQQAWNIDVVEMRRRRAFRAQFASGTALSYLIDGIILTLFWFEVQLPQAPSPESRVPQITDHPRLEDNRVLLVEDDPVNTAVK